jgi:hypothetical protein
MRLFDWFWWPVCALGEWLERQMDASEARRRARKKRA